MKRSILWLLLTMFIAAYSIAYADTVQIGTGTSTTSYLPLYGYYGYSYTQQIYTQTQIGVSGNIEKIRFYYVSGTITNSKDWVIYMGHTTKTTFSSTTDWEPLANLTQVFSGDVSSLVPQANNWMEITLDTPFSYNNTDNLVIAVDENTSGYASMSWGAFSSGSNTGIYYRDDSTNPDPASPPTAYSRTSSINRIQLVFPSTSAPLAPTLVSPSDEATGVALNALLTWSATAGGGDATSYDVYMDTVDGSTLVSENQVEASYSVTLAYGTTYYWKVVASNAIGDSPASDVWSFTAMADPTIVVFPWVEDFGTETTDTFPPQNWTRMGGQYPTTSGTNTLWARGNWLNGATGNNDAKMNIYGTSRYAWIISPPIAIPATGYELKIDLGLTDYGNGNPIEDPTSQLDDKFIVAISSSPDMSNPTILREWNNSGSEYVYNEIPNTGTTAILDLDGYVGTYYVAFYGESTLTGGDNDFHFDNVTVRETPESPIISVTPDTWDFGTQLINTTTAKEFTISNIGAGSLNVSSINVTGTGFALAEAFSPVSLLPTQSTTITVNFSPQTETTYSGNIAINDNRAVTNIPLIGAAIDATIYSGDLPHIENFDSVTIPDLPVGWTSIDNNADNDYWKTATGYANSGDKSASIYTDYNTANDDYLVTPPIELTGSQRLSFWTRARSTSEPEELSVVLSTTTPTSGAFTNVLMTSTPINFTTYTQYNIDLDDYNGICYIAFKRAADPANGYYLYIDDVKIDVILPEPPEPATLVWPLNGITTLPNPLLKWAPSATGEPVTTYKVYMNDSGTFTETDLIYEGTATQFQTADMGYERTYYWKVLPINAHGSDPTCPTWSFLTPLENQLAEGFESTTFPPVGWQRTTSSSTYWGRSTTSPLEGTAGMYAYTSTSTVYTISTPMLTINSSSSLDFFAKVTDVTQKLQILESTDRINWTQVGADITFATANVWNPISVNLSVIDPGNYYLAFSSPGQTTGSRYIYVDHIIGPEITPLVPGTPALTAPADAATNQSNYPSFTWTSPTTGGVPSGYNLYLDTVDGSTLYASNVTSPYVPTTALDWETIYYWTVKAFNNAGTGEAPVARSFTVMSDPTIYTLPYTEGFENGNTNGSTSIANWSQAYVTGAKYWTANSTNTTYNRTPRTGSFNATLGWSASTWMFRPIELTGGVSYDMIAWARQDNADTDYASLTVAYGTEGNAAGMVNTIVPETGLTSGDYQMLSGSFTPATSGVYYIGILGTLPTSTNWYLSLDDITFRESPTGPPDPVTLNTPADEAENLPVGGFNLSWSPALTGGSPSEYAVFMGSTVDVADYAWYNLTETSFDPTQSAVDPITFAYGETWYWTVMASNGDGDADAPNPFSFTIMDDPRILSLPYSQNFDSVTSPNLPAQWVGMVNPTSTSWYVDTYSSTTYAVSQPNTARMYNSSSTTADIRLISPEVVVPMNSIKLSFSARGSSGYTLLVGTTNATDATGVFNQLASITLTATHTVYTVSLADYVGTDQYICFKHGLGGTYRTIYIDDVNMEELTPYDLAVTDFAGDSYGLAGDQLSYTVTVTNNGTAAQNSYSVQLLSQTRDVLATLNVSESLEPGASAQHIINWTPSIADTYDVYAKVILAGDANPTNDESYLITVAIFSVTSFTPLVGNIASATSTTSIPFHMYWKNNVAETIYMAHEMQMVSGTINAIVYHNNFTQNINVPVKVWMKHTTESINAAWLPFDDYTLVYDGNIFFPAGVNPIVIPLQTPFQYTGGNLAIRTNRVMDTRDYGNSEKYFYTTDNMNPNRTRYYQADSSVIDPANPGLTNAGTQSSMIPNTGFIVDPYVALPAPSAPVVQIAMSGTNPQLSWNAVDNAYVYAIYGSDDPYDWSAESEIATTSGLTYNIASPTAKKFYKVVARTYGHQDRSLGIVLNPASVIGFDNSSVKRMLPTINTENKD